MRYVMTFLIIYFISLLYNFYYIQVDVINVFYEFMEYILMKLKR